jgi:hypothetical protein
MSSSWREKTVWGEPFGALAAASLQPAYHRNQAMGVAVGKLQLTSETAVDCLTLQIMGFLAAPK